MPAPVRSPGGYEEIRPPKLRLVHAGPTPEGGVKLETGPSTSYPTDQLVASVFTERPEPIFPASFFGTKEEAARRVKEKLVNRLDQAAQLTARAWSLFGEAFHLEQSSRGWRFVGRMGLAEQTALEAQERFMVTRAIVRAAMARLDQVIRAAQTPFVQQIVFPPESFRERAEFARRVREVRERAEELNRRLGHSGYPTVFRKERVVRNPRASGPYTFEEQRRARAKRGGPPPEESRRSKEIGALQREAERRYGAPGEPTFPGREPPEEPDPQLSIFPGVPEIQEMGMAAHRLLQVGRANKDAAQHASAYRLLRAARLLAHEYQVRLPTKMIYWMNAMAREALRGGFQGYMQADTLMRDVQQYVSEAGRIGPDEFRAQVLVPIQRSLALVRDDPEHREVLRRWAGRIVSLARTKSRSRI